MAEEGFCIRALLTSSDVSPQIAHNGHNIQDFLSNTSESCSNSFNIDAKANYFVGDSLLRALNAKFTQKLKSFKAIL